ncbi:MAG: TylF/MycF/NovP-related O-methyltransferase [Hyphomicrobiales bacterium]
MRALRNFLLPTIARKVRRDRLTYLSPEKLKSLISVMKKANANGVEGNVLEMGIALGGSGIVLASIMGERDFYGYDVFGLIPPPSDVDGKRINFVPGLFEGTLPHDGPDPPPMN